MFGIDEIFDKLINEAKSVEDIKKLLINKYVANGRVPNDVFDEIFTADPTKKKSYVRWMLDKYENESRLIDKIAEKGITGPMFKYFQERSTGERPINLVNIPTVERAYSLLPEEVKNESDDLLRKNGDGPENDFDVVYDTPEWKIVRPNTYEAAEKLGEGCKWCTSGAFRNGQYYFDDYTSSGPLWINFDYRDGGEIGWGNGKEYPFKRYQFCFERNAYMDHHDDPVKFDELDMPEEVVDFYGDEDASYKTAIEEGGMSLEERYERYSDWRWDHSVSVCKIEDNYLNILPEFNQDYEINENAYYYLYDTTNDDVDPICWSEFNPNADFIVFDGSEDFKAVVLKDSSGDYIGVYYGLDFDDGESYHRTWESFYVIQDLNYGFSSKNNVMWMFGDNMLYVYSKLASNTWNSTKTYDTIESVEYCGSLTQDQRTYIQVKYRSEPFGLYVDSDDSKAQLKCIIKSDYPKNGNKFTVSRLGDNMVIEGKLHTYSLNGEQLDNNDSGDISDLSNYHVQRKLTDIIYVVEKKDDYGVLENLYDAELKQKLLPTDSRNILTVPNSPIVLYASDLNYGNDNIHDINGESKGCPVRFFNYANRRFSMTFNRASNYDGYLFGADDEDNLYILNQDMDTVKTLPGYIGIGHFGSENALYFKDDSGVHCCLVDKNLSIQIPNGIDQYTSIRKTTYAAVKRSGSKETDIVDIRTWDVLVGNVDDYSVLGKYVTNDWNNSIKYCITDHYKWNVIYDGKILLPFNVDEIDVLHSVPNKYIPFKKNDSFYIFSLESNSVLPNKNGFSRIIMLDYNSNGTPFYHVAIAIPENHEQTSFNGMVSGLYDVNTNTITKLTCSTNPSNIDYLKQTYNYKPAEEPNHLSESFRKMMDRMDRVVF